MTLKLNEKVTREQLEELGFEDVSVYGCCLTHITKVSLPIEHELVTEVYFDDKEIHLGNSVDVIFNEIPTIIKTMIEKGYC